MIDQVMSVCDTEEHFQQLDGIVDKLTKKHKKKKKINLQDIDIYDQINNLIKQYMNTSILSYIFFIDL